MFKKWIRCEKHRNEYTEGNECQFCKRENKDQGRLPEVAEPSAQSARLIKFRAWRIAYAGEPAEMFAHDDTGSLFVHAIQNPDIYTLMQFTGLKDSEGVEIYEGDIVCFTYWWFDGSVNETPLIGEVVYQAALLSYALRGVKNRDWIRHIGGNEGESDTSAFAFWRCPEDDFKVLGNIYENPDLLQAREAK
jgi:uncharacterized phage protein (TIGR01671 family)